jgi:protein O-mannosyl-transferase
MSKSKKNKKEQNKELKKNDSQPIYIRYWKTLFFLLILIVYGQTINFDFVHLDDTKIIIDNHDKISSLNDLPAAFTTQYGFDQGSPYYRPIILISFIIDSQFSGLNPVFYHISNLIFHYLMVCFLFLLLIELKLNRQISFFLAVIFAVHPVLTNAVVWIAGRNDILVGLFSILSFLYFIRYAENQSNKNFGLHIVFYLIALLSKELALILPLLFLVYFFIYHRDKFKFNYLYKFLAIWIVSIIVFQIVKSNVINEVGNLTYGIPAIINNIQVIPEILYKIFIPINISVLPTFTITKSLIGTVIFLIILFLPFLRNFINKKNYYFGLIWFLLFVLPGLAIYYADQSSKFDYLDSRIYLPFVGMLIILSEVFRDFRFDSLMKKQLYIFTGLIILLSGLTFVQSKKYSDGIAFAESAVLSNPQKPFFYHKLADYYFEVKDYPKAIQYIQTAIKLDPDNPVYYKNLILAYTKLNEYDNAINSIFEALKISPNNLELIRGLMVIYFKKGDYKNALLYADKYASLGGVVDKTFYEKLKNNP